MAALDKLFPDDMPTPAAGECVGCGVRIARWYFPSEPGTGIPAPPVLRDTCPECGAGLVTPEPAG